MLTMRHVADGCPIHGKDNMPNDSTTPKNYIESLYAKAERLERMRSDLADARDALRLERARTREALRVAAAETRARIVAAFRAGRG